MFKRRTKTELGVIHCAATKPNQNVGATEIRDWHLQKGWVDIGYHFIIKRDGTIEFGRPIYAVGAHAYMHNSRSIGVCLVGGVDKNNQPQDNFTDAQWDALDLVTAVIEYLYPGINWDGHRELRHNHNRACPSFEVEHWLKNRKSNSTFSDEEFNDLLKRIDDSQIPKTIPNTIRKGSRGEDVRVLQRLLELSLVDGIFGPMTLKAVKKYQRDESLSVDGIVGPNTWSKLLGV